MNSIFDDNEYDEENETIAAMIGRINDVGNVVVVVDGNVHHYTFVSKPYLNCEGSEFVKFDYNVRERYIQLTSEENYVFELYDTDELWFNED